MVAWDSESSPDNSIQIKYINHFSARGMHRVYGRGDVFPTKCTFNMDVWCDRRGRLLSRFWSRSNDVDGRSLEIRGISVKAIPEREPNAALSDAWIPQALRQAYEDWIRGEW